MLHQLVGDDAFFRGLRRFYTTYRFQKAGSDDLRRAMEAESGLVLDRFFEQWIYGDQLPNVGYSVRVEETAGGGKAVIVRFEQVGQPFDVPVTVSVDDGSGRMTEVVVSIREASAEARVPVAGAVKKVEVNRDSGALGSFTENRGAKQ
jgi:aminopeptidase N